MLALVLQHAISLTQQLNNYKEYQSKVVNLVGTGKANAIFSGAIHLLSAGSSDFIQNFYVNPLLYRTYSPQQFSDILITSFSNFIQVSHFLFLVFLNCSHIMHREQTKNKYQKGP